MSILNLRGTNGSGKSTIAHRLLKHPHQEIVLVRKRLDSKPVVGYRVDHPKGEIIIVGPYRTQCGGCDAIPTQDLVCAAVRAAARQCPNVFFEGLLVSGIYARYQKLSETCRAMGRDYVWGVLQTPLEESLRRVYARNGGKPIKEELVEMKLRGVESAARKARAAGEQVVGIPWRRPFSKCEKILLS